MDKELKRINIPHLGSGFIVPGHLMEEFMKRMSSGNPTNIWLYDTDTGREWPLVEGEDDGQQRDCN